MALYRFPSPSPAALCDDLSAGIATVNGVTCLAVTIVLIAAEADADLILQSLGDTQQTCCERCISEAFLVFWSQGQAPELRFPLSSSDADQASTSLCKRLLTIRMILAKAGSFDLTSATSRIFSLTWA